MSRPLSRLLQKADSLHSSQDATTKGRRSRPFASREELVPNLARLQNATKAFCSSLLGAVAFSPIFEDSSRRIFDVDRTCHRPLR
jgi:hypothetical protein